MSWFIAPLYDRLLSSAEDACLFDWRGELLSEARGEVLEIGGGTGLNLAHYPRGIDRLVITEPDAGMRRRLVRRARESRLPIEIAEAGAEALPFADESFDTVVVTLVLCTVHAPQLALGEIRRVLRPGGRLLFLEHVAADAHQKPRRLKWQRRVEPVWKRVFGNCHLTRQTAEAIAEAGFDIVRIERESMRKAAAIVRPTVRGVAVKPA